jgi:hypothetical protein
MADCESWLGDYFLYVLIYSFPCAELQLDRLSVASHASGLGTARSDNSALRASHSTDSRGLHVNGVRVEAPTHVVNSLVLSDGSVRLSNRCTPRSGGSHIHPDSVGDVVIAGEAGLLFVGLLRDHGAFQALVSLRVNEAPQFLKLFENLRVVLVVLHFVRK